MGVDRVRARNLKPGIFKNELLATSDPLNTWIFEGLWCLADREGRLEDRPRRIHLEINPGRAFEGTEAALAWLAKHGFIIRYAHGSGQYIQIVSFAKHQNPHVREPASSIPPPGVSTEQAPDNRTHINEYKPEASHGSAPDKHQAGPALSSFPLPESPSLTPEKNTHTARASLSPADQAEAHVMFERIRKLYPPFAGRQNWIHVEVHCHNRIAEGSSWNELIDAVKRYAAYVKGGGVSSTAFVLSPEKFFSAGDDPWKQQWPLPEKIAKPPVEKPKFVPPKEVASVGL